MQLNFTQKKSWSLFKFLALPLVFALTCQVSFSQQGKLVAGSPVVSYEQRVQAKQARINAAARLTPSSDNDMGRSNTVRPAVARIAAVCQTYTGSLAAGDLTMPARLTRPGATTSNCTVPYVFPGPFAVAGGVFYDTYTYTNTTGLTQCGIFTLTTTDLTNANIQHGIYNGTFDPNNIATNYLADPGVSTGTPQTAPLSFQRIITAGQTIVLVVWSTNSSTGAAGTASNYTVTIDFPICSSVPCSGTPNPGNTISSVPTVCPAIAFTLSTQNATAGAGVTYLWQSSPTLAGPYTNIPGGTGPSLSTTQSAATFYRVIVTCGANQGTSNPVQVLLTPTSGCYCAAGGASAFDEKISRVQFNTIDNPSTATTPYENFTAISTTVIKGQTLPITVSIAVPFNSDQILVWIDFNQNGSFSDAGERVYTSAQGVGPHTGNITIPLTALTGPTRMRVRLHDAVFGPLANPCGTAAYGQVEDYTVDIQPCVNASITTQPVSTTIQCSGNATFTVGATGSALVYGWEYRATATSPWQVVTNGAPYSGATTNTLTVSNAPSTLNGYQYRALVSNPCTGIDFTSIATLTVGPLVAVVNPASATICSGSIQQLTLTNASSPATSTFSSGNINIPIPDLVGPPANSAAVTNAGINHSIPVTFSGIPVITQIDVKFNITHPYSSDLIIVLRSPSGQILNLAYHRSGAQTPGANYTNTIVSSAGVNRFSGATNPYTGIFRADLSIGAGAYADAVGSGPLGFAPTTTSWNTLWAGTGSGNWTIAIVDPVEWAGDAGVLNNWDITFTYGAAATGVWTALPAAPNSMFTDAAATVPYVAGSLANTIYVRPLVSTSYSVVYGTATPCTSAPTVVPVTVINPIGTVTQPTNKTACVGTSTTFTASALGGPNTYQWQVSTDGGATYTNIAGATSSTYTVTGVTATMNNYLYRAVITAAPCAGSVTTTAAKLTVNNLPTVTLTSPDLSITPGQSTTLTVNSSPVAVANGITYTLNGVAIPGTTNTQSVRIDGLGVYQATVTDINGCVNKTNTLTIGAEASDRLWIYPNPSPGAFQVRLYYGGTISESRRVSIYNALGQLVAAKDFDLLNTSNPYLRMDFDLSKMADGPYVVKVHNRHTGQIVSGLLIKNH